MGSGNGRAAQSGSRGSSLIMTVFGAVWWLSGTVILSGSARIPVLAAGIVAAVVLFVLAVRRLDARGELEAYERAAGRFRTVNIIQGLLIGATAVLANVFHVQPWIPGAVAIIVGLHFLPLAGLFGRPEYRWIGVLMAVVGVAGCAIAFGGGSVTGVLSPVGMACTLVLWGSVVFHLLARSGRPANADA